MTGAAVGPWPTTWAAWWHVTLGLLLLLVALWLLGRDTPKPPRPTVTGRGASLRWHWSVTVGRVRGGTGRVASPSAVAGWAGGRARRWWSDRGDGHSANRRTWRHTRDDVEGAVNAADRRRWRPWERGQPEGSEARRRHPPTAPPDYDDDGWDDPPRGDDMPKKTRPAKAPTGRTRTGRRRETLTAALDLDWREVLADDPRFAEFADWVKGAVTDMTVVDFDEFKPFLAVLLWAGEIGTEMAEAFDHVAADAAARDYAGEVVLAVQSMADGGGALAGATVEAVIALQAHHGDYFAGPRAGRGTEPIAV